MTEPRYCYLHVQVTPIEVEPVSLLLWESGAGGIEERETGDGLTLVAYFPDETQARVARSTLRPRCKSRMTFVVGDEWRDAWKKHFKPTRIGQRLIVQPSWDRATPAPGEIALTLDPGRAFGTGTHETTRLVLREIDRRIRGGEQVLDVGCGSGILSVAALLLGARHAIAVDNDPDVLGVVDENAALNRVSDRLAASTTAIERIRRTFDLVVANIEARVLVPMARALASRVRANGVLVLSGILRGQWREMRAAYRMFERALCTVDGEWIALILQRGVSRRRGPRTRR